MPDKQTEINITIKAEIAELKRKLKDSEASIKKLTDSIKSQTKEFKSANKAQIDAIQDLIKAVTGATEKVKQQNKKQKEAVEATTKAVEKQLTVFEKLKRIGAVKVGVAGGAIGGAVGGFLGGAGAGGLRAGNLTKNITSVAIGTALGRMVTGGIKGIFNFAAQGGAAAYQQYMQYGAARGGLVGLGAPGQFRGMGRGGAALGFGPTETMMQARGIGRATGNIGAVYRAQQFARAYGLDVGEAGGYMGMIRQAGFGFGGQTRYGQVAKEGTKALTEAIEAGMISGLEKGRLPEFLQGVANIAQQVGGQVAGRVNVRGIAAFQTLLASTKESGLMGARGAAVAAGLGRMVQAPGGGEAGQAMVLQALGFGKPGGRTPYYEAVKMQQRGLQDPNNVIKVFREVYRQFGAVGGGGSPEMQQEANLVLSRMSGYSLDMIEKLSDIFNSSKSAEEKQKAIEEEVKKNRSPQEKALEEMKGGFGRVVTRLAGIEKRQIAIGAKFAPIFEKLQDVQLDALSYISKWLPDIGNWLKESYVTLSSFADATLEHWAEPKIRAYYEKAMKRTTEELMQVEEGGQLAGKTIFDRLKALKAKQDIYKKRLGELVKAQFKASWGESVLNHLVFEEGQDPMMRVTKSQASWIGTQLRNIKKQKEDLIDARRRMGIAEGAIPTKAQEVIIRKVTAGVKPSPEEWRASRGFEIYKSKEKREESESKKPIKIQSKPQSTARASDSRVNVMGSTGSTGSTGADLP